MLLNFYNFEIKMFNNFCGGCGEMVNASACGADIRGFDPHHPPQILINLFFYK